MLQMIPKLQILLGKGKVTFSNNNKKENIFGFKFFARRHLGFHDVTALSYCFKQKNVSFPTIETTQWRHEIQDGGAREI